jgi:hypothetical protein
LMVTAMSGRGGPMCLQSVFTSSRRLVFSLFFFSFFSY